MKAKKATHLYTYLATKTLTRCILLNKVYCELELRYYKRDVIQARLCKRDTDYIIQSLSIYSLVIFAII